MATPINVNTVSDNLNVSFSENVLGKFIYKVQVTNEEMPLNDIVQTDGYIINRQSPILYPIIVAHRGRR